MPFSKYLFQSAATQSLSPPMRTHFACILKRDREGQAKRYSWENLVRACRILSPSPSASASASAFASQLDLLNPKSELTVNETQFSGLHIDGGEWRPVASAAQLSPIVSSATSERERIMSEQGAGLSARCVTIIALRFAPTDGSTYGNTLYMIDLAAPPIAKASGVPGLALDDYCSINTSLKTLTKCLTAMGSRKKAATPPLRDSRLTHLLGLALGDDSALIHCLVYVPGRRSKRAEAVAALQWAARRRRRA